MRRLVSCAPDLMVVLIHLPIAQLGGLSVCVVVVQFLFPLVAKTEDAQALQAASERAQRLTKTVNFGIVLGVCEIALRFPSVLHEEKQKTVGPPEQLRMNVAWQTARYPL
ncbi:MAG: hypothetical protein WAN35_12445, partial [Terracidiphilus sp.]